MNRILFYAMLIIVALPAAAMAQGSGAEIERPPGGNAEFDRVEAPFIVYRSMTGKVVEVNAEVRTIGRSERRQTLRLQARPQDEAQGRQADLVEREKEPVARRFHRRAARQGDIHSCGEARQNALPA